MWFSDPTNVTDVSGHMVGKFKTTPSDLSDSPISFAVGGDLAGQNYCKRADIGYPIFTVIKELNPDFFVANGDMIYADSICTKKGPENVSGWENVLGNFPSILNSSVNWENSSQLYDVYSKHWEYNKSDKHYQNLYKNIPVYSQADDHEVADDYSGNSSFYETSSANRSGFPNLIEEGLSAFFNFSPIEKNVDEPHRIYRSFDIGKNLDLFLLDAHQYRTQGTLPETRENIKTLLGEDQFNWLKASLRDSNAIWKVILTDVPVTIPNCFNADEDGCDNWATDNNTTATFTQERASLMKFLDDNNIQNVIFVVTDTHYPANVLINQDFNSDGDTLKIYEFISGPLNAGTFEPDPIDKTINAEYLYNETGMFNFGYYKVEKQDDGKVHFMSEIHTSDSLVRDKSKMDLVPE